MVAHKKKALSYGRLRKFIKTGIKLVGKAFNIKLNPKYYTPHSLQVGGCTDLSRAGATSCKVSTFGRWISDFWKQIYVNIDFLDLARPHGTTVTA